MALAGTRNINEKEMDIMKKQLWQMGSALGAFLALAYLVYAFSYTMRIGSAYVFGPTNPERASQAQREDALRESAPEEPSAATPEQHEVLRPPNQWASSNDTPVVPSEAPSPRVPAPDTPVVPAQVEIDDSPAMKPGDGHEPNAATVAYRGPTYDEMRSKLEQAQHSSTRRRRR